MKSYMSFFTDTFTFTGSLEPREKEGITFIGPDLFAKDDKGNLLSPIASVFPKYRTIITVRGIHACHASAMLELLKLKSPQESVKDADLEFGIYQDAVALLIRNDIILIRSDPEEMEHIFAADEILQRFLPKERIQFTGLHLPEVRSKLRHRGESWRMSPPPRSLCEIGEYVRSSKVQVTTGLTVYYNAPTGGRFLTYAEFAGIRNLIEQDPPEALARLKEIHNLLQRVNNWGSKELTFFLPAGRTVDFEELGYLISLLQGRPDPGNSSEALAIFDRLAEKFSRSAGPELTIDVESNAVWRTTMFCRLYDINEQEMEEWALGLSPEFHLNVKWLPGASVSAQDLHFHSGVSRRVQGLISHFWNRSGGFKSINIGHVEVSQSERDISGEERDVYLAVMTTGECQEAIRLIRLMKWDVIHRIKMGVPLEKAISMTLYYRNYIFDRLHAAAQLGFPILSYNEIRLEEEIPGLGQVPAFFFDRRYVPGVVTDKIPLSFYGRRRFILKLSSLLGAAATFSLVLGRASPRTGKIFYDDGDELIQFDTSGIPTCLINIETTGSFTDWTTPIVSMLPQCLVRFRAHLNKALERGVPHPVVEESITLFADALIDKLKDVRETVFSPFSTLRDLFKNREPEPGGIRNRWEGIISRLENTDPEELRRSILSSEELKIR